MVAATHPSLVAAGVNLRRGDRAILREVSLEAKPGEVTLITGRSGSGKSSLLSLLSGLELPDSGEVRLGEVSGAAITARMGLVLQGYGLVSLLTAAENIEVGLYAKSWEASDAEGRANELLGRLGLEQVRDHLVERMSGGQQQRVAIARALAPDPEVVLADEPTAELDVASRRLVVGELAAAATRGAVVVIATHDKELREWAHKEVILHDGEVVPPPRRRR